MIEAMYGVKFHSNMGDFGFGVVILETGRVLGGDSSCVYVGEYRVENGILKAHVEVTNDRKVLTSIFGDIDRFHLNCSVKIGPDGFYDRFVMDGEVVENPEMKILVEFTRRAELP